MMKKLLPILLILALLLGCAALAEEIDLVGEWHLTEGRYEGVSYPAATLGVSMTLVLNEDGTGTVISDEETADFTWARTEGGLILGMDEEDQVTVLIEDGRLLINESGVDMILDREASIDLIGEWHLTEGRYEGVSYPAATLGVSMTLVLNGDGTGTLISDEETTDFAWAPTEGGLILGFDEEVPVTVLIEDGRLLINVSGVDMILDREAPIDLIGEWYLTEEWVKGRSLPAATLGVSMTLVLNEDGTGTVISDEGTADFTWVRTGGGLILGLDEEVPVTVLIEDGRLLIDSNGYTLVLDREVPEALVLPEAVEAESEADFLGTWRLYAVQAGTAVFPEEDLGMEMTAIIEKGKLTVSDPDKTQEYASVFENGVLTLEGSSMIIQLNADGSVSLVKVTDDENGFNFNFVRVEE